MKILVLSQYFTPEPITKPLEIAEALRAAGHSVHVVTGFPNYPDGKLYPGFPLRLFRRDIVAGIPVIRTWVFPSHGTSRVGRLLNYASFMVSSIAGGLLAGRFDAIYVWHPPLSIGVAAAAIAAIRRRGFVYDVLDIWPESALATGFLRPGRLFNLLARLETFVYRRAAHIFVVTDSARANLIGKGVPHNKITVQPPWYDDANMRQIAPSDREAVRSHEDWHGRFVVMFAGNMGVLQGLDNLLHSVQRLPRDTAITVAMVGDGMDLPRLKQLVIDLQLTGRSRSSSGNRRLPWRDTSPPRMLSSSSSAPLRLPAFPSRPRPWRTSLLENRSSWRVRALPLRSSRKRRQGSWCRLTTRMASHGHWSTCPA